MIYIRDMIVTPVYPNKISVTWTVNNEVANENYNFFLYITDDPTGREYTKVNTLPILNEYQYDFTIPIAFKQEYMYIILEVEVCGDKQGTQPKSFTSKISMNNLRIAKEIIRRKDLLRNQFSGIPCYIKKRKILGETCTECSDPVTGYRTKTNCLSCYGTMIKGGYNPSIKRVCEIVEGDRAINNTEIGVQEHINGLMLITYPLLFKGDIVIEKDRNKRWYVQSVQRNMIQTFPVDQKVNIRQLSPTDMEYKLDV